jgi:putative aldouronate transport system substrate-binding protein
MTARGLLLSRRAFLRAGTGAIAFGGGMALLGACASNSLTRNPAAAISGARNAAVQLPTRVPVAGLTADLPGTDDARIDGFFVNYPANPPKTVQDTPGQGGTISAVTWTTNPLPSPMDSNLLWQAVNKALGVTLRINIQEFADYQQIKLPTLIAGNDLPDIVYIAPYSLIPKLPTFLKSKMADLTPYLSGDAVKDYPNLANFPTIAWRQMVFNNAIYGIPCPTSLYLWVHWLQQDLLDAEGLSRPRSADEYKQLAVRFTRPDQGMYGLGAEKDYALGVTNGWITGIFGAPNGWQLDERSGKLTYMAETEQFRAAVGYARDLWAAGVYHPNAMQYNLVSARNDFAARKFMFRMDAFSGASDLFWATEARMNPPGNPQVLPPFPSVEGGTPTFWTTNGILGFSVLKQAPPDRIKEILRVMNWLAAPLGTQEYLLKTYGLKDVHWTPDDNGNPILNARGKAESTVPFQYLTRGTYAQYWPATPQNAPVMYGVQKAIEPYLSLNPTDPYYSETNQSKDPQLRKDLVDRLDDIIVGRQPFSAFDDAVKNWQSSGGDQIRQEFEQAIAATHA